MSDGARRPNRRLSTENQSASTRDDGQQPSDSGAEPVLREASRRNLRKAPAQASPHPPEAPSPPVRPPSKQPPRSARDGLLIFATRITRLFAYGFLSVFLALYLTGLGLNSTETGVLLTLALLGDTGISLWLTTRADRVGRRRMLIAGAILMLVAGVVFAITRNYALLLIAATIGVISPSGSEAGPFLAIEQAALSQMVPDSRRVPVFAWYNLVGPFATATGALVGGSLAQGLQNSGMPPVQSYRAVVIGYALAGLALAIMFSRLSPTIETPAAIGGKKRDRLSLHASRPIVMRLSALFALDAFGGGFVLQTLVAYWLTARFQTAPLVLGAIFFAANILAGVSALAASRVASRIGILNTMAGAPIPSNIFLILVPFMPNLPLAIAMLLLRFSIPQMDGPTQRTYILALVSPDEKSAAADVSGVTRSVGAALSPALAGLFLGHPSLAGVPFLLAGSIKIAYELMMRLTFRGVSLEKSHSSSASMKD